MLINNSSGANQYRWFIDGFFYSSSRDTSFNLVENCYDRKDIQLIVCDSATGACDTVHRFVEVFDSCYFHWTGDFFNCPGDTITLHTHNEATGTRWDVIPPTNFLAGCDTCPSISLVLQQAGSMVDETVFYDGGCSEIISFHYLCMTEVSEIENTLNVFPNPVIDFLNIEETESKIEEVHVFNSLGILIFKARPENGRVDFRNLSRGAYYLRIAANTNAKNVKGIVIIKN
jgi:hypothetical protein